MNDIEVRIDNVQVEISKNNHKVDNLQNITLHSALEKINNLE